MWREIDGGDDAILVERDARIAESALVAVGARNHVLGAGFNPLDRASASFPRSQRAHRHLRIAGDLDAEAAADIEGLHADLVDVYVQVRRQELDRQTTETNYCTSSRCDRPSGFHSAMTTLFSSGVLEKRWKCRRSISTT